jgi:hypothetical protein
MIDVRKNHQLRQISARILLLTLLLVGAGFSFAYAAITLESFTPPVEVQLQGGEWIQVSGPVELTAGDSIATGKNGSAALLFEDGSTLQIESETQLAIEDLQFSEAEEVRVSKLKLLWGAISAKAKPLNYKTNTFQVETQTALAGFKFSGMRIVTRPTGQINGISCPCTQLYPIEGLFELQALVDGDTRVICQLEAIPDAGIGFNMDAKTIVMLSIDQTREREQISIQSNYPLPNMYSLLNRERNVLRIDNNAEAPTILIGFQRYRIELEEDSAMELGFAPFQAEQQIEMGAAGIDGVFIFGRNTQLVPDRLYVYADEGILWINGEPLAPGTSALLPITGSGGEPPAPAEEPGGEQPIIPPAPTQPPTEPVGSPILP